MCLEFLFYCTFGFSTKLLKSLFFVTDFHISCMKNLSLVLGHGRIMKFIHKPNCFLALILQYVTTDIQHSTNITLFFFFCCKSHVWKPRMFLYRLTHAKVTKLTCRIKFVLKIDQFMKYKCWMRRRS